MSERGISFETLNAYVDGELDAAAQAEVARAVADDPELARQVAALSRLRSAVADSVEPPVLRIPSPPAMGARAWTVAAAAALVMFVAGSMLVATLDRDLRADWLARAWELHRGWSVDAVGAGARPNPLLADYADAVPGAYVPDLAASRLTVAHAAVQPYSDGRQALMVGYRGTRGCKITLVIFADRGKSMAKALAAYRDGGNEAYAWRAGRLGYVILSDGMDPARFRLVAESVRETSLRHLPFDPETRIALRRSRDESVPCAA